jgi:hypothetical protein
VAATREISGGHLSVGLFQSIQQAATLVDRLLDAGLDLEELSMLMSDRTAERHLGPPNVRNERGSLGTYSAHFNQLAASLSPMAALGTPGSGLVAAGALPAALVAAGLGSRAGLEEGLSQLGIAAEEAGEIARRVKNGAVLVGARLEQDAQKVARVAALLEHESSIAFDIQVDRPLSNPAVVTRPRAPVGDQRARYEPVIETQDEATGSSVGANNVES